MQGKMVAILFLAGSSLLAQPRVFVGVGIGYRAPAPVMVYEPPPVAPMAAYVPACPGPAYSWVSGYWYPVGRHWSWHAGYWARPRYARSYWVAPRYYRHRYYAGYWRRHR